MFSLTSEWHKYQNERKNRDNLVGQLTIGQTAGTGGVSQSENPLHRRQSDRGGELRPFLKVSLIHPLDIERSFKR